MNRLRKLREEKNLYLSDVAKIINKTANAVGQYELGRRDINTADLVKLAEFYDVSVDYLLGKTDIRSQEEADFRFAYHKETEGLTGEEIREALEFYKLVKKKDIK